MDRRTFRKWASEFRGVAAAVKKAGGGKITSQLIEAVVSISVERVDRLLLSAILQESNNISREEGIPGEELTCHSPLLLIVWSDNRIERSDRFGISWHYSTFDSWTKELVGNISEDDQDRALPIASHFTERDNLKHIVLAWIEGGNHGDVWAVSKITIVVYKPPKDSSLQDMAKELMEEFDEYGDCGFYDCVAP